MERNSKTYRLLEINNRLLQGDCLNKKDLADSYQVDVKSIQRDMEDIRSFLANQLDRPFYGDLIYDRLRKGYRLVDADGNRLTQEMVLSMSKILLESRAFVTEELNDILGMLLTHLPYESKRLVNEIVLNQQFHYQSPSHGKQLLQMISDLSVFIVHKKTINLSYKRADGVFKTRRVNPLALVFSEFYFYLIADITEGTYDHPAIFRVDRIEEAVTTEDHFRVTTADRFEDGQFVQKVPFMYAGKLQKISFEFYGKDPGVVLDRVPSSSYIESETGTYIFEAEVFGDGILMWLLSQGKNVKVTAPPSMIEKIKREIAQLNAYYDI